VTEHRGPIYEVTLQVDDSAAAGLDDWLELHAAEMLSLPGFEGAEISKLDDSDGRKARVVRYTLADDAALETYLAGPATAMRQATIDQFGEQLTASRRILRGASPVLAAGTRHCLNCDHLLLGQYCGSCGQRASSRLISIWELFRDAFVDLLDVDSRLWRTLGKLAFRPGQLTRDYLRGRRARYVPPFRTYLVLSIVFFVIALFDPREQLSLFFEPADPETEAADVTKRETAREELLRELEAEGIIAPKAGKAGETDKGGETDEAGQTNKADSRGPGLLVVDTEDGITDCEINELDTSAWPGWLSRRLTRERLQGACEKVFADGDTSVRAFAKKLTEYIPAGLFVLLPLMALVLKILYPLSKRYYVEHLLFVLHFHAFVFLVLSTQVLVGRTGSRFASVDWATELVNVVLGVYIFVYLYKAMRRVYEQGHWLTAPKFLILQVAYTLGLGLMLATIVVFAAFSA
jgi:hypothetical protein